MDITEIQKNIDQEANRIGKMPMPPLRVKRSLKGTLRAYYYRMRHFGGRCYRFAMRKARGLKRRLIKK